MALPTVVTKAGLQPRSYDDINSTLISQVTAQRPGYTASLPGSLIDDISSTDTLALMLADQARLEVFNSLTTIGSNDFVLNQQGNQLGIRPNLTTNGSVDLVCSNSTPGFFLNKGFTVSDGSKQYVLQSNATVRADGTTGPLNFICMTAGTFAIPANTVSQVVTALPAGVVLTISNPQDGIPGQPQELSEDFRMRVVEAQQGVSQGMPTTLKAAIKAVPGVVARLVSASYTSSDIKAGYRIIVGGGDNYDVANAIFSAMFDLPALQGSSDPTRTVTVNINDDPDTYTILFGRPLEQKTQIVVTWNTISGNTVSDDSVTSVVAPVVLNYINTIVQSKPINENVLREQVLDAMATIIPRSDISRIVFGYTINGTVVTPPAGTQIIPSNPEGYFSIQVPDISVIRG